MDSKESKSRENLETVKGWLAIARESNNKLAIQIIENLFPEFKESKDEKIRKELIRYVKEWQTGYCMWNSDKNFCNDAIAWLEKQGEQKPTWSEEDDKFLNYAISLTDDAQIKNFLKSLKDRVQPQPKQDCNEEDMKFIDALSNCINELKEKCGWNYVYA